jgi:hypothetical protein
MGQPKQCGSFIVVCAPTDRKNSTQGGERWMDTAQDRKRCLERLCWATEEIGGRVDHEQFSKIANLIIQAMTGPWRYFHTPSHIFEVGAGGDAIEVIAALFHDLVYVQVDQGISVNISRYIAPYIKEDRGQLVILECPELQEDVIFTLTTMIFGFRPGQPLLPMSGQNEFLSALICGKLMENVISIENFVEIATCIEATIPFRTALPSGLTSSDLLYGRLSEVNQRFHFDWSHQRIVKVIQRAVRLANRDVENFASPSASHFLNNTWNLIPETNHDLKNVNSYTVHGYRISMQKMEGFMNFLTPELVFRQYHNEPDNATYNALLQQTHLNLEVSRLYLGTKLTSISILEALSFRIGRDIPLSTMMGELPLDDSPIVGLEQFLPEVVVPYQPANILEKAVLELLEKGRTLNSSYDVKNSPTATFMVKFMGFAEVGRLLEQAKAFFRSEITAEDLLNECNPYVVRTITDAVIKLFDSRKKSLCTILQTTK